MNIQQQLHEILATGLTQLEVGTYVGLSQPQISRLVRGKCEDTKMSTGKKIEALHYSACGSRDLQRGYGPTVQLD